jgi:FKBP-type peptidyl-prolyl cis-trans isomerase FkpA
MIRFFKIAFVFTICLLFAECRKDDDIEITPPRPFAEQEPVDFAKIEDFLNKYSMKYDSDYNVTFTKIPQPPEVNTDNLESIMKAYATDLKFKKVTVGGVEHRYYYIKFREGTQLTPTKVDDIFISYTGRTLDNTVFEQNQNPVWSSFQNKFTGSSLILGWKEVITLFKSGTFSEGSGGVINYANYGAGVMFIPSAMAYYNSGSSSIAAYSPLIFNFKLNHVKYIDHDDDGILSKDELYAQGKETYDDTDGDGRPDYIDQDDDGDNFLTSFEIQRPKLIDANGLYTISNGSYPFNGAAIDDPLTTTIDESQGIPNCSGDFTLATRTRKHLDKTCH